MRQSLPHSPDAPCWLVTGRGVVRVPVTHSGCDVVDVVSVAGSRYHQKWLETMVLTLQSSGGEVAHNISHASVTKRTRSLQARFALLALRRDGPCTQCIRSAAKYNVFVNAHMYARTSRAKLRYLH